MDAFFEALLTYDGDFFDNFRPDLRTRVYSSGSEESDLREELSEDEPSFYSDSSFDQRSRTHDHDSEESDSSESYLEYEPSYIDFKEKQIVKENTIEEYGFRFNKTTVQSRECVVEIVMIGNENCGKTHLIETIFSDHSSLTVENYETRDEHRIHLSENVSFHILIYDVKDMEFLRKTYFRYKTVFIFCYTEDDLQTLASLEKIWIPLFQQRYMKRMSCLLVNVEQPTKAEQKPVTRYNEREMIEMREKVTKLLRQIHNCQYFECSTDCKDSMLSLFQCAFNAVYIPTFI